MGQDMQMLQTVILILAFVIFAFLQWESLTGQMKAQHEADQESLAQERDRCDRILDRFMAKDLTDYSNSQIRQSIGTQEPEELPQEYTDLHSYNGNMQV